MKSVVDKSLIYLAKILPAPLYIVGGSVRDFIAGLAAENSDTDICAPLSAEEFSAYAKKAGLSVKAVYKNTGTVKLCLDGADLEFTSFRSDEYVRGSHVPVNTFFTDDIRLDALRRDFKCNAVYYDISAGQFVDPLGGIEDAKCKILNTVAAAEKVFGEDGLRLMRLARIAAQTGFTPSQECLAGAKANAELIKDISAERIYAELFNILHADKKYGVCGQLRGLEILRDTGVLKYILPELALGAGMAQNEKFHKYDVLEHSLRCAAYADDGVRLAALLHDIGKPYCFVNNGNYIGHETEGARIAEEICIRLKVPKKLAAETVKLIALHMYDFRCDAKENKVRKFIIKNFDVFFKLLKIKQADYSACRDDFSKAPSVEKFEKIYFKMKSEGVPFTLKELEIKGDDVIVAGVPAEEAGRVLNALLADCAVNVVANDKQKLISHVKKAYLPKKN